MTARDIGRAVRNTVLKGVGRVASRLQEERDRAVDVLESPDEYLVVFDVPGATASDVQVRYDDAEVLVRVDRFRDHHDGFEMVIPGRGLSFDGSARLPDEATVDPQGASAKLNANGTLYVTLPKAGTGRIGEAHERVAVAPGREDAGAASAPEDDESVDRGEPTERVE